MIESAPSDQASVPERWSIILRRLTGWRRRGFAMLLGVLAGLSLPPVYALPCLIPAFTGLLWMAQGSATRKAAFGLGWWFGLGYFGLGFYWIGSAFFVDAARFGWMAVPAVLGLAGGLAIFSGLSVLAFRIPPWRDGFAAAGMRRVVWFALVWSVLEWLRGWVLTGFPWNLIGSGWEAVPAVAQLAAVTGVWGLSFLTVVAAAAPAILADGQGRGTLRRILIPYAVLIGVAVGGALRMSLLVPGDVEGVTLRLVQPNIPQHLKWQPDLRAGHVRNQIELSLKDGSTTRPTHVIWAETAVPYFLASEPKLAASIARAAPAGGVVITGAPRKAASPGGPFRAWNSLHALDPAGAVVATYDKFHLVPFGEYVPLKGILPIEKLTQGRSDFSPGEGPITLSLPGLPPVSPLICYEIIFPGRVVAPDAPRPEWLLNLTNDAWFGQTAGPYQHLATAAFRAIEEGLPVVRVANTGISAVIDPMGRKRAALALGERGYLDAALPAALPTPTLYARFGDTIFLICALFAGIWGLRRKPSQ